MKSLIQEAIRRASEGNETPPSSPFSSLFPPSPPPPKQAEVKSEVDRELEEIVQTLKTKIKVVGCGGGGCNTLGRLQEAGVEGVELFALNTDAQHLLHVRVPQKLLLGKNITRGLGAGALPEVGEKAARESESKIREAIEGADMVFVTAGMGGGTGTGSAPVVAEIARDLGALTIAVVTLPFSMEGQVRMRNAEEGLRRLKDAADTTIVVPNDRLLKVAPRLPLSQAFRVADEVLVRSIRGLSEMVTKPGIVNLDFADLRTVMRKGGVAMIGLGEGEGENRASESVEEAISSPLLDVDVSTATGCLVDVCGGPDMTLEEAQSVVQTIHDRVSPDCRIIWGASVRPELGKALRTMVVLTGVRSPQILGKEDSVRKVEEIRKPAGVDFLL